MKPLCIRLLGVLLLAFASAVPAADSAGAPAPERKVLRVAFRVAETSFDPAKISDLYSRNITPHIFESLYRYDHLARPIKLRPLTADGMPEHSADFRVWTVKLKPGIYFADDPAFKGQRRELVAEDYVYSIKRLVDPANKSPVGEDVLNQTILGLDALREESLKQRKPFDYDRPIEGMKAIDRYTLRFKLAQPRPRFGSQLAQSDLWGAVAREVVEAYGEEVGAHPVGTGPFRLKQWRRSSLIVLERNPNFREMYYDAEPAPDDAEGQALLARFKGRRIPMVDEVQISIIEEDQPRWLAFLNGQTDMIGTYAAPLPNDYVNIAVPGGKLAPNLAKRGIVARRVLNSDIGIAVFNMDDPVVGGYTPDKVALRRAISLAYNTPAEIRFARKGQGVPAQSRLMPNTSGYDPKFKSEASDYDPGRAKALLDLYGYVDKNGDGWRDLPDGSPLVLRMNTQPDQRSRLLDELWKKSMGAIGVRIEFLTAKWPENLKTAQAGRFMMWQLAYSSAGGDGLDSLSSVYSPHTGAQNLARFKLAEMDKLYDRMSELEDGPERDALFLQAKRLSVAYMPYKPLLHRIETDLVHPWVIGYRRPVFWNDWWHMVDLDTALRAKAVK
ncbi:ABC transporter substrate-binding protein [Ideonella sp. BN130291]|uniref:ABC transporter substrate-binding protein n=1 Tax=Ideonella sp. BN130291 TaxID=3112940 RepID=UPI002E264039|nr:ABC transporter substrate-binding protein [Ideonella sp. BN130291]